MSRKEKVLRILKPVGGVVFLAVVIAASGGACSSRIQSGRVEGPKSPPVPAGAELYVVKIEPVKPVVYVSGTVNSEDKVHISARLGGYVKEVPVSAGAEVKKGQLLLKLEARDAQEQVAAAEAHLAQASNEFSRARQLLETKATTEQSYQAAEAAYRGARAQAERAQVMLGYAELTSPIDGTVTDRRLEAGDLANPGQVLLSVFDPQRMRLEAPVPVRLIDRLALNQAVTVTLDRPAREMKGQVTQIVNEVDPLSRTQIVKVRLDGDLQGVLPGSFGRLQVEESARPALLVPASALYRVGQLELVNVEQNARAVQRLVKTGAPHGPRVEILAGLQDGDRILTRPLHE